jgi:small subunit ribosomal protein S3
MKAGALGVEMVLSGRLPSERARSWRFSQGYLKKTGDPAKVVDRAMSQATTQPGVVGIKVSILPPNAHIHDRIVIDQEMLAKLKSQQNSEVKAKEEEKNDENPKPKKRKKSDKAGVKQ